MTVAGWSSIFAEARMGAWFSAGGGFRTQLHGAAKNTRNAMFWAPDAPQGFRQIYRSDVPLDTEHWHMNADREVVLERPAKAVFVRYVGDPAVNTVRIDAHCVDDRPRGANPVRITHEWTEAGERKTHEVVRRAPGAYEVVAGGDQVNVSIEMAIPSVRR